MNTSRDDLVELSEFAFSRLRRRMGGLTDEEYLWGPVANCRTIRPLADGSYVGRSGPGWRHSRLHHTGLAFVPHPHTAARALEALDGAYAEWRGLLADVTDKSLDEPIGDVGGPFADDTRRAFVLHILDELIHHGAEAALLRDLYRERPIRTT